MKKCISQEWLKIIACVTMLLDHLGAVFFPGAGLRIIGRLAFPIYAFLLCEGFAYTRNPTKYCLRLLLVAMMAELPFDYLFYGGLTWEHQSVMVTLVLGAGMILLSRKMPLLVAFPFCFLAADCLRADYGGWGIAVIAMFAATSGLDGGWVLRQVGLGAIFMSMNSYDVRLLGLDIPIQLFGVLALIPIGLYSGRKLTQSRLVQVAFYLFYPVHMTALLLIRLLCVQ